MKKFNTCIWELFSADSLDSQEMHCSL